MRGKVEKPLDEYLKPDSWYVKNADVLVISEVLRDLYTFTAEQLR